MAAKRVRQSPISVDVRERELLGRVKRRYESAAGEEVDWGEFLTAAALFGLVVAGLAQLAKSVPGSEQSRMVTCGYPDCARGFPVAVPLGSPWAVSTPCPYCGRDLVVDLRLHGAPS
jgi:hypothetical protein